MAKQKQPNKWKEHHDFLERNGLHSLSTQEIMRLCGWSRSTFYRNLKNPENISISEKLSICSVYQVLPHFLFPDVQPQKKTG